MTCGHIVSESRRASREQALRTDAPLLALQESGYLGEEERDVFRSI